MGTQLPPPKKKGGTAPNFRSVSVVVIKGWMDQDTTWYGGRPQPRPHCVRWGPSFPLKRAQPPVLGACLLWPNGWMVEDATWYGSRPRPKPRCVRRENSAPPKGAQQPPLFGSCLFCGHGRPSQLLLSSCLISCMSDGKFRVCRESALPFSGDLADFMDKTHRL